MHKPVLLMSVVSVVASAQSRNATERVEDHHALHQDARQQHDDQRDLQHAEDLLADFDSARARHDFRALNDIDARMSRQLASEVHESDREVRKDDHELRQDHRELGADRREGDRRDAHDDHRDLRDDHRDAHAAAANDSRARDLATEWSGLNGRMDPRALDRKREIINQYVHLSVRELHQDEHERREDVHELREDRREAHQSGY